MAKFGKKSKARLKQCHPLLKKLCNKLIKHRDITILCGFRGEQEQIDAFNNGFSKVKYPHSRHNMSHLLDSLDTSDAVDIAPYPIPLDRAGEWDIESFRDFGNWVTGVADGMGIKITWGADWNRNYSIKDEKFKDFPHFELRR